MTLLVAPLKHIFGTVSKGKSLFGSTELYWFTILG